MLMCFAFTLNAYFCAHEKEEEEKNPLHFYVYFWSLLMQLQQWQCYDAKPKKTAMKIFCKHI